MPLRELNQMEEYSRNKAMQNEDKKIIKYIATLRSGFLVAINDLVHFQGLKEILQNY